jgi:hypothetical protein
MNAYCTNCGDALQRDAKFCSGCGNPVSENDFSATSSIAHPDQPELNTASYMVSAPSAVQGFMVEKTQVHADAANRNIALETEKQLSGLMSSSMLFVFAYIVVMLPTYFLPYLGSNSTVINGAVAASGAGMSPVFLLHALALGVLVTVAWARGKAIGKSWLAGLSVAAALFDILPGLSMIPIIPTTFHMLVIVLGLTGSPSR